MGKRITIKSFEKVDLVGCYFENSNEDLRGSILMGCAMGITQKYYRNIAKFFSENGYNVLTFDFRGTGLSSPKNLKYSQIDLFDWSDDIKYCIEHLKIEKESSNLIYVGHSISSQLLGFAENNVLVNKVIFLASSTGFWRDLPFTAKWKSYFLLSSIMTLSLAIWGYTNARFFGLGENYPKGASLQWRKWCMNPEYLGVDLTKGNRHFDKYKNRIVSYCFTDDPIANDTTVKKLLDFYSNADTKLVKVDPREYRQLKIGHTGFLSRRWKSTLWGELLDEISA